MTAQGEGESVMEPDDEETIVVSRVPATEQAVQPEVAPADAVPDEGDETVVVPRVAAEAFVPEVAPADAAPGENDETVVVPRAAVDASAPEGDETVVVPRVAADASVPEGDETVVVPRAVADASVPEGDETVVVERQASAPDDSTIVVRPGARAGEEPPRTRREAKERRAERMRIELPDGQEPSMRVLAAEAEPAVPTVYPPRAVPEPPADTVRVTDGATPTRAAAPLMPSVRRSTVRFSAVATGAVVAACVVSVVGLVLVWRYVFTG